MKFTTTLAAAALVASALASTKEGFSIIPDDKSDDKGGSKANKILLDVMKDAKSLPPIELGSSRSESRSDSRSDDRKLRSSPLKGSRSFSIDRRVLDKYKHKSYHPGPLDHG